MSKIKTALEDVYYEQTAEKKCSTGSDVRQIMNNNERKGPGVSRKVSPVEMKNMSTGKSFFPMWLKVLIPCAVAAVVVMILLFASGVIGGGPDGFLSDIELENNYVENTNQEEVTDDAISEKEWEALYAKTLKMYWDVYAGNIDPKSVDITDSLGNIIILDRGWDPSGNNELSAFKYSYYDINGDSIPELLVAPLREAGAGPTVDIYSINADNTVVPVLFTTYHRIIYSAMHLASSETNKAYIVITGGDEGYAIADIYEITSDNLKAIMTDSIRVAPDWENNGREYYRGIDVITFMEAEQDQGEVLSEDEYNTLAIKYGGYVPAYIDKSPNHIELDWKVLFNPEGAELVVRPSISGGAFIRSQPVISGESGIMDDGNKIGYIPAERTDIALAATGNTALDEEGYYFWYEVEIPQSYRDSTEQSKYYSDKPLTGWVREDLVKVI